MLGRTHWYPLREKRWLKCTAVLMTVAAYCLNKALSSGCRIRAPLKTFKNSMISSPQGNSLGIPRNISSSSLIHKLFWRVSRPKSSFPAVGEKRHQQSTLFTTASLTTFPEAKGLSREPSHNTDHHSAFLKLFHPSYTSEVPTGLEQTLLESNAHEDEEWWISHIIKSAPHWLEILLLESESVHRHHLPHTTWMAVWTYAEFLSFRCPALYRTLTQSYNNTSESECL